jgi:hypothetical protein
MEMIVCGVVRWTCTGLVISVGLCCACWLVDSLRTKHNLSLQRSQRRLCTSSYVVWEVLHHVLQ